jgi:hypothetical protein
MAATFFCVLIAIPTAASIAGVSYSVTTHLFRMEHAPTPDSTLWQNMMAASSAEMEMGESTQAT